MALQPITGSHHITAYGSDPQRNLHFYTGALCLRYPGRAHTVSDEELVLVGELIEHVFSQELPRS